jgi:serine/threonine protein kinase
VFTLTFLEQHFRAGRKCFELRELFGTGAFGTVVSAVWRPDAHVQSAYTSPHAAASQLVAVKKIENVFENSTIARRTLREIILLRLLRSHENVR